MKLEYSAFVYKWTNSISNEYYIGVHKGDVEDGYIGSGLKFKSKFIKHKENFKREIISFHNNFEEALSEEARLVTRELILTDKKCLNLQPGGKGGSVAFWDETMRQNKSIFMKNQWTKEEHRKKVISSLKAVHTEEYKKKQSEKGNFFPDKKIDLTKRVESRKKNENGYCGHLIGKKLDEIQKKKLSDKAKQREKVVCPHCEKIGSISQMKQWHFDKCKEIRVCL